jgi:hypothetical protein
VAIYAARAGLTGRTAPAVDWAFTVEVVPGLSHPGEDGQPAAAWAVVDPQVAAGGGPFPGGTAHVQVRDIDATPVPGFDGDPLFEIRVTLAHETLHCVVAEALAATGGGTLTVPAEEQIVEAAAQAIVRSEGTADARVMARAIRALPSTLRARVAASAGQRARKGVGMDGAQVLAAIAGQDEAAALKILNDWAAEQLAAAGHPAAPGEPDGDEAAKLATASGPPQPGDPAMPAAPQAKMAVPPPGEDGAAGRKAARLVADLERMHGAALPTAKAGLIAGARARLAITPAIERRILAASTFEDAEAILAIVEEAGGVQQRARSGVTPASSPDTFEGSAKTEPEEKLLGEGFDPQWISRYREIAKREGAESAAATLARGRVAMQRTKARRAREATARAIETRVA